MRKSMRPSVRWIPDNHGAGVLHVEAPGCIVNIITGLVDANAQDVTSISITTDAYHGERAWRLPDLGGGRIALVRVVRDSQEEFERERAQKEEARV